MGGILNGMALHGGVRPYGGTFLIFSDYMRPSIRLAALMHVPVTYVFTHDSIGVGEDGPTHQPIEQLMSLRAIPGVLDLRPGDGPETAEAWRAALAYTGGPSFLALTRQAVAIIDRDEAAPATGLHRGGYVLLEADGGDPEAILIASGSEVGVAVQVRAVLQAGGVPTRVVSLPSWYLFARQPQGYRDEVLPPGGHGACVRGSGDHGRLDPLDRRPRRLGGHRPLRGIGSRRGAVREVRDHGERGRGKGARAGQGAGAAPGIVLPLTAPTPPPE